MLRKISVLIGAVVISANFAFAADPAYIVEEVPLPKSVAPEIGGLAFNKKGELVVVTRRSGILIGKTAKDPSAFEWRVFSNQSLHEPLGVLVENDDQLLVPQFPELTRIRDTDKDGVADLYETVSTAWGMSGNYHESVVGPVPDGEGNWFLNIGTASHNGPTFNQVRGSFSPEGRRGRNFSAVDWRGWVVKIRPDGSLIPWASGFRANNGLCVGPDGSVWVTDNQGDFIPTSPLYHVEQGKFYGHPSSLVWDKNFTKENPRRDPINEGKEALSKMRTMPAVQFPHGIMINSPGEPIFDLTKGKFGPFAGQMFVPDESGQRILRLMLEKVGGAWQGACVVLIKDQGLRSGNNRVCFSPEGDVLYTGQTMRGWGGPAEGLQRIVYNGKPIFEVKEIHLQTDGFELTFTEPVKKDLAKEMHRYGVQQYLYPYSHQYGAPQTELVHLTPKQIEVSNDGMQVRLRFAEMKAERIYQFDLNGFASEAGRALENSTICYTLNRLR